MFFYKFQKITFIRFVLIPFLLQISMSSLLDHLMPIYITLMSQWHILKRFYVYLKFEKMNKPERCFSFISIRLLTCVVVKLVYYVSTFR